MGSLTVDSWRRLNDLVASYGDEDVLHMICEQVVLTGDLAVVGQNEAILQRVLWKWLKDPRHPERMEEYKEALEFKGEKCVHEAMRIVDSATPEDVNVKKLRSEFRKWVSGKWNKDRYGDSSKMELDVRYQVDLAGALLEAEERRARLVKGETIDNESGEVI